MSHPGVVGEDPNHIGATLDLGVEPFEGTGRPDLLPVVRGEWRKAVTSSPAPIGISMTSEE